jgi:hypothetical protein
VLRWVLGPAVVAAALVAGVAPAADKTPAGESQEKIKAAPAKPAPVLKPGEPAAHGLREADLAALRTILRNAVTDKAGPGVALLLARRGEVVLQEAFGDLEADQPVKIASDWVFFHLPPFRMTCHGSSEVGTICRFAAAEAGTWKSIVDIPSGKVARSSCGLKICLPCEKPFCFLPSNPAIRITVGPGEMPGSDSMAVSYTPSLICATFTLPRLPALASGMNDTYPAGTGFPLNVTLPDSWPSFTCLEQPGPAARIAARQANRPTIRIIAAPMLRNPNSEKESAALFFG